MRVLSPSAPLNPKEAHGVGLARRWAAARYMPHAGADGVIRYPFGATLPTVVCAPLQVCDLLLQPGEVINNINAGDKVRWSLLPATSGSADGVISHIIIKPLDAGLVSSMTVLTNRRAYAVKLVSTQAQWMPLVGFTYPEDQQQAWTAYQQTVSATAAYSGSRTIGGGANMAFYSVGCEGNPPWKPLRAWTDGIKTYVEFSGPLNSGAQLWWGWQMTVAGLIAPLNRSSTIIPWATATWPMVPSIAQPLSLALAAPNSDAP